MNTKYFMILMAAMYGPQEVTTNNTAVSAFSTRQIAYDALSEQTLHNDSHTPPAAVSAVMFSEENEEIKCNFSLQLHPIIKAELDAFPKRFLGTLIDVLSENIIENDNPEESDQINQGLLYLIFRKKHLFFLELRLRQSLFNPDRYTTLSSIEWLQESFMRYEIATVLNQKNILQSQITLQIDKQTFESIEGIVSRLSMYNHTGLANHTKFIHAQATAYLQSLSNTGSNEETTESTDTATAQLETYEKACERIDRESAERMAKHNVAIQEAMEACKASAPSSAQLERQKQQDLLATIARADREYTEEYTERHVRNYRAVGMWQEFVGRFVVNTVAEPSTIAEPLSTQSASEQSNTQSQPDTQPTYESPQESQELSFSRQATVAAGLLTHESDDN